MTNIEKRPIHLLVRFSDNLFAIGDVITKHREIIMEKGCVWFGKLGTPIGRNHIDAINQQVHDGIPSFLYLVKGNRRKSTFFRANIVTLALEYPKKEKAIIPPYYFAKDIIKQINFWAKVSDIQPLSPDEMKKIKVKSSVFEIEETLLRSSSGHFIIREIPNS